MPDATRILVIRRRYLGDIALLSPVFRNLRLNWRTAHVAALVEPAYAGTVALHPDVDETLTFPASGGWWAFARRLRAAEYTHVLDFDNTERTALLARFSGAPVRATFRRERVPYKFRLFYTHAARVTNAEYESRPITETYLRLPEVIGVPVIIRDVRLVPGDTAMAFVQNIIKTRHNPLLVRRARLLVHPGSRSPCRLWPADRFAQVIERARREVGARVALVAGPGERELVAEIAGHCAARPEIIDAPLSIPQLAALMTQFEAVLCHDSGPMHLAAGVGTPVVALYGSQNATIWRPPGDRHRVLQTSLPCPCLPDLPERCVKQDSYRSYCVRRLGVDEVFAAVAGVLTENS